MDPEEQECLSGKPAPRDDTEKPIKMRYVVAILGSMGMAIIYGLKVNLSVAIVAMVNHTALAEQVAAEGNHSVEDSHSAPSGDEDGPFIWSLKEQGAILSSYFLGYFITQVPGGRMAELYSAKYVFLVATLMNTLGSLASPLTSYLDYRALMVARVIQGLGGGFTFPAMNVMIAAWAPPAERSTISSIAYSGTSLGTVLSMLSSGLISSFMGWEAVFYIQGGLSLFWCLLWVVLVSDSPPQNRFTTKEEAEFIEFSKPVDSGKKTGSPPAIPWKSIFTSVPFIALSIAHFLQNTGWYMLLVELPLFARTGLEVDMQTITILSCTPFFANWIFSVTYSKLLDTAKSKDLISTGTARKISVCVASILPGLCLVGICLAGTNIPAVVALTILAVMFYGSMYSGVFSNHCDLAPNFAGTLMAITNMLATIPGFLVPLTVGAMTSGGGGLAPWHTVFYCTSVLLGIEAVVYGIFGKGELQPWNSSGSEGSGAGPAVSLH